jgi:hypothetical protein
VLYGNRDELLISLTAGSFLNTFKKYLFSGVNLQIFESALKIFGPGRILHNEEVCDFFSSHNIVRIVNSERLRLTEHTAYMEKEEKDTKC